MGSTEASQSLAPLLAPRRALWMGAIGFVLELFLITPWSDDFADANPTFHFTQHGLVFLGGLLMGWALLELRLASRLGARG